MKTPGSGDQAVRTRIEAVRSFASAVEHEVANPLAAATASVSYAAEELGRGGGAGGDVREALQDAQAGLSRISGVLRDLRAFTTRGPRREERADVRRLLENSLRFVGARIRERARLVVELEDVPAAAVSEGRVEELILDLLLDAADAIGERRPDRNEVRVACRRAADGRIALEFSDTGLGVATDLPLRALDPASQAYLSRPARPGLAACEAKLAALGGEHTVESRLGEGTTVRVLLPAAAA